MDNDQFLFPTMSNVALNHVSPPIPFQDKLHLLGRYRLLFGILREQRVSFVYKRIQSQCILNVKTACERPAPSHIHRPRWKIQPPHQRDKLQPSKLPIYLASVLILSVALGARTRKWRFLIQVARYFEPCVAVILNEV